MERKRIDFFLAQTRKKSRQDTKKSRPSSEKVSYFKPKETKVSNLAPKISPPSNPVHYDTEKSFTIFGKPQTEIDPELKICPYCQSKIKKMWSTCPICGKDI